MCEEAVARAGVEQQLSTLMDIGICMGKELAGRETWGSWDAATDCRVKAKARWIELRLVRRRREQLTR